MEVVSLIIENWGYAGSSKRCLDAGNNGTDGGRRDTWDWSATNWRGKLQRSRGTSSGCIGWSVVQLFENKAELSVVSGKRAGNG
jgi:hypothetical protein